MQLDAPTQGMASSQVVSQLGSTHRDIRVASLDQTNESVPIFMFPEVLTEFIKPSKWFCDTFTFIDKTQHTESPSMDIIIVSVQLVIAWKSSPTAWVRAGQPFLAGIMLPIFTQQELNKKH